MTTTSTAVITALHEHPPKQTRIKSQVPVTHLASTAFASFATFTKIIWGFIKDDVSGFVIPSSIFGVLSALASHAELSDGRSPSITEILRRMPLVLLFNLCNIVIWDLSNQRAPESVEEDQVNKPWRPIPAGKITINQTRRVVLVALPMVLLLNYCLGVHVDGLLLLTLCWYYNDLKASDEICRDIVIATCYTLANKISFQIALGGDATISTRGYAWIATISAVSLSTMHTQDLKDQVGDKMRGRITVPLLLGDEAARAIIAFLLPAWSCFCGLYWGNGNYWLSLPLSLFLSKRVWQKRTPGDDSKSWKLWCLWHMTLFAQPLLGN